MTVRSASDAVPVKPGAARLPDSWPETGMGQLCPRPAPLPQPENPLVLPDIHSALRPPAPTPLRLSAQLNPAHSLQDIMKTPPKVSQRINIVVCGSGNGGECRAGPRR